MTRMFKFGDKEAAVTVRPEGDALRVTVDGEEFPLPVRRDAQGAWVVDAPTGARRFWAHATAQACRVFGDGRVYEFGLPDPEHEDLDEHDARGPRLVADMPGKVVKLLVAEGDAVVPGQPLVIMESMKMETELAAAVGGTVRGINVAPGQVVGQGDLLVEIEPEAGS